MASKLATDNSSAKEPLVKNFRKSVKGLVRNFRLKDSSFSAASEDKKVKIVLYKDDEIIQMIRDRITAEAFRDESRIEKIKRVVKGNPLAIGDYAFDGLTGVDEVVFKPTTKIKWVVELGADIQLKWNIGNNSNIDMAIQILFSAMWDKRISVSEAVKRIKSQKTTTPSDNLVFPNMPISLFGKIRKENDFQSEAILIHDKRSTVKINLMSEHNLSQAFRFLKSRMLCVIGIVENIESELSIRAGALLLDQ